MRARPDATLRLARVVPSRQASPETREEISQEGQKRGSDFFLGSRCRTIPPRIALAVALVVIASPARAQEEPVPVAQVEPPPVVQQVPEPIPPLAGFHNGLFYL